MPLQATSGAASYDAFGGGVPVVPAYIEEVFSAFVYAGSDSAQTLTDGIDRTKGALDWFKVRSVAGENHILWDTVRSGGLETNTTSSETTVGRDKATYITQNNGNVVLNFGGNTVFNRAARDYVKWTFRKQPKFFDVVTYTGNGVARTIAHNLGSVPGCIIIKKTSGADNWAVYHRSLTAGFGLLLNDTGQAISRTGTWTTTAPTSTVFSIGTDGEVNSSGATYVAYLFAHDAGGFGLTGTDNVISCGSWTVSNLAGRFDAVIDLGWEPQWILFKSSSFSSSWQIYDNMRGFTATPLNNTSYRLYPNTTDPEDLISQTQVQYDGIGKVRISVGGSAGMSGIYMAIRRGPMKVPTSGTSVFGMSARSGTGANATVTGGQTDDAVLIKNRGSAVASLFSSRLTGTGYLVTATTAAEVAAGTTILQANPWDVMDGVKVGTTSTITNASANTYINYLFKRAPSFMDVVCYTGTGVATNFSHNLQAVPQLMFVKARTNAFATNWYVYNESLGATKTIFLDDDTSFATNASFWNNTTPTSSVFTIGTNQDINSSGYTNIAYLFATCAGVSKVGSYTGNGSTQTIDCGITAGARFVLIRRTNSSGNWYVYDTARGMTTLTDPYWLADTTAAEVATLGSVTTVATGFAVNSAILAAINLSASTYLFLAIA